MKKSVTMILVLAMVLSCLQYAPQKAMAAEEFLGLRDGQIVTFKNAASGWFMNLQHGTDANGAKVNVYQWDETPPYTQKYKVSLNADGSFKLAALCAPSRFVDVRRYSKPLTKGQGIVIWSEDGDTHKHLRLKKVGDKVAIVFANNTNLCIAPSSAAAAQTTQKQMVVRELDASQPEMLWTVSDEEGNPIKGESSYQCFKIIHCESNKVLKRVDNKLVLADFEIDDDSCFWGYGSDILTNLSDLQSVSLLGQNGSPAGCCKLSTQTNPVKLNEIEDGVVAITTTVGNTVFALDVKDGDINLPLQTWQFDCNNPNQRFSIEKVNPADIKSMRLFKRKVSSNEEVQRKIDVMLDIYRERYEKIFKDEAKPKEIDFGYKNKAYFYGYFTSDGRSIGTKTDPRNGVPYIVRDWFKEAFCFDDDYFYKKSFSTKSMFQCCAFASLTADYLFGYQKESLEAVPSFTKGKPGLFTWEYLKKNDIKAGDLLYLCVPVGDTQAKHYVVVYDVDYTKETITIVHANAHQEGETVGCKIIKETLTRQELEKGVGKEYTHFGERCTFRKFD